MNKSNQQNLIRSNFTLETGEIFLQENSEYNPAYTKWLEDQLILRNSINDG